jgi:hypothetical protein
MTAYPIRPKPGARCNCGPRLLCTHALVPIDTREPHIAAPKSPGEQTVPPATQKEQEIN